MPPVSVTKKAKKERKERDAANCLFAHTAYVELPPPNLFCAGEVKAIQESRLHEGWFSATFRNFFQRACAEKAIVYFCLV